MKRKFVSVSLLPALVILLMGCLVDNGVKQAPEIAGETSPSTPFDIKEDFQEGSLSPSLWTLTRQNDFRQSIIDVVEVGPKDYRLRLLADTVGTKDDTVKFHGIRSLRRIDFTEGKVISFELDWNNQANGSYLTAGIYLCPTATNTNPGDEADWLSFEYIGVPPGQNARFQVASASGGNLRLLHTEGWPDKQRTGRKIANQRIDIFIDKEALKVIENGRELFSAPAHGQDFTRPYLYFQMSSHSNYPSRQVFFDNVSTQPAGEP